MNDYRYRINRAAHRAANSVINYAVNNPDRALQVAANVDRAAHLAGYGAIERAARNTVHYATAATKQSNPRQPFHRVKSFLKSEMPVIGQRKAKKRIVWKKVRKPVKVPMDEYNKPRLRTTKGGTVIGFTYGNDPMPPPTPRRNSSVSVPSRKNSSASMEVDKPTELQDWVEQSNLKGNKGTPHSAEGQITGTVSKTRIRLKKRRKGKKRKARNYYAGNCTAGAVIKKEANVSTTGKQTSYVTVSTPIKQIRSTMIHALIKTLFSKLYHVKIEAFSDVIDAQYFYPGLAGMDANMAIYFTKINDNVASETFCQAAFVLGTTTYATLAATMQTSLDTVIVANAEELTFSRAIITFQEDVEANPAFPSKTLPVTSMTFKGYWSTRVAFQNATPESGASSNITDTVLSNPIEYESFKGKGNGPLLKLPKRGSYTSLIAADNVGYSTHNPDQSSVATDILADGCTAKDFKNAKKIGKGVISPGAIKDFFMKDQISGNFMRLYAKLLGRNTDNVHYCSYGNYLMNSFDKIVTKATDVDIKVNFETTFECGGFCNMRSRYLTNPVVTAS